MGARVQLPLTQRHIEEIYLCANDISYFIENYVKIFTLDNGFVFPELRDYQEEILDHYQNNRFSLVMMSRQAGKSVTTLLYLLHSMIFNPDTIIGIVANALPLASELLSKIIEYYEQLPLFLQVGVKSWNKTYIILENGSKIITSSAENGLRGYSASIIMIDEMAFIDNAEKLMTAILPTLSSGSNTKCIITSTPNGMNYFYDMWVKAEKGKSSFKTKRIEWWRVPGRDETYKQSIIDTQGLQVWLAEYECEFKGSAKTLIDTNALEIAEKDLMSPIEFDKFIKGLKIYEDVIEKHRYILSADAAKDGTDNYALHIIDITSLPFRQVVSGKFQISHLYMPEVLNNIGLHYNNAFMVIENNEGAGQSNVDILRMVYEYDNIFKENKSYYGFRTTTKTRPKILSIMKKFIENGNLLVYDIDTLKELNTFIEKNGKYQADSGKKDDLVMSLAITFAPYLNLNNVDDYREFLKLIEENRNEQEREDIEMVSILTFGSFDDATPQSNNTGWGGYTYEGFDDPL
jgi:hypothetical protein